MRTRSYLHPLLLSTAFLAPIALALGGGAGDEKAYSAEVAALAKHEAESYELARVGDDARISLRPDSVFQWTNPVIGIVHGRLMLWTANGRPEAIVGVYKWFHPITKRSNEFSSLSTSTFLASRDGGVVWSPRRADVEFKPVPAATEPASTPAARLRQMRDLAKEFAGRETTRDHIVRELRLLIQPIYRYDGASPEVIDGALFVFAQGTDPKVFLMIEARKVEGAVRWHYALARMNSIALQVEHKGREVWSVPTLAWSTVDDRNEPYTTYRFDSVPRPGLSIMETRQPSNEDAAIVARLRDARARIKEEMAKVVVGQEQVIDHLLVALLCRGHVLLLGVPGVGKTLMSRTLSRTLDMEFRRIQFTPDLMPSDITGMDIIEEDVGTGHRKLEFLPGPIFANFLLADEINRTPPKTQSALLQAMQENEVTIGRRTYPLKPPFFVVATQNPIEMEGTYPLPEAQLDRFMFNIKVKYPSIQEELQVVKGTTGTHTAQAHPILKAEELIRLQDLVRGVPVADSVMLYAVRLVAASRPGEAKEIEGVHKYLLYGASPRASQYLVLGAKARAILAGKYHVDFEDVKAQAGPVLRHRLVLNFHARADGVNADAIVRRLIETVRQEG